MQVEISMRKNTILVCIKLYQELHKTNRLKNTINGILAIFFHIVFLLYCFTA